MAQRTDKKTLGKKIASLSALGASVLAAGTGTAEAGVISGTPGTTIGPGQSFSTFGAGGPELDFFVNSRGSSSAGGAAARASAMNGAKLAYQNLGSLELFPQGAKWAPPGQLGAGGSFLIGGRSWSRTFSEVRVRGFGKIGRIGRRGRGGKGRKERHDGIVIGRQTSSPSTTPTSSCCSSSPTSSPGTRHRLYGNTSFSDEYALFTFQNGPTTLYGWVDLSYSVTDSFGPNGTPDLTINSWAYDDSGAVLPAGDTTVATPEPGTGIATALAALALGAGGLRRWRKARKAA